MDDKKCRILIADDNKDIHDDIKYILGMSSFITEDYLEISQLKEELFGVENDSPYKGPVSNINYRIDDAYRGDEAINMVRAAKESDDSYSLVFMDIRMPPGIDGIEAIESIWTIDSEVGIVICTAYSDYTWDQIIAKLGHNDNLLFIRKPFDSISLKQITLAMTTNWNLKRQIKQYIDNLESQVKIRTQELTVVIKKLETEIVLRKEKEKQLAYNAYYDSLTKLLNRHSFYSTISKVTDEGLYGYTGFSFFYIDIDDFKSVNDLLGHDVGDKLLVEVALRIRRVFREHALGIPDFIDEKKTTGALYRLGGDEFTVIVRYTDRTQLGIIAQEFIENVKQPFHINGYEINTACCIGISSYPKDGSSAEILLKCADTALYEAKKVHGGYCFYSED